MKKIILISVFILLSLSFIYAQEEIYSDKELQMLAAEKGISLSPEQINELRTILENNEIKIEDLNLTKIESMIEEKQAGEEIEIEEIKEIAKEAGINESQVDKIVEEYIGLNACNLIEENKDKIINQTIPEKIPYNDEVINLYLSEEILGHLVLLEGKIKSIECEENENPTYKIYVKNSTVILELIENFEIQKLNQKLKNKEIEVEGTSIGKKIKWFFSKMALKFIN